MSNGVVVANKQTSPPIRGQGYMTNRRIFGILPCEICFLEIQSPANPAGEGVCSLCFFRFKENFDFSGKLADSLVEDNELEKNLSDGMTISKRRWFSIKSILLKQKYTLSSRLHPPSVATI